MMQGIVGREFCMLHSHLVSNNLNLQVPKCLALRLALEFYQLPSTVKITQNTLPFWTFYDMAS